MTIQEAINSGLQFKRPSWDKWLLPETMNSVDILADDVLAIDWMTRELTKEYWTAKGETRFYATAEEVKALGKEPIMFREIVK